MIKIDKEEKEIHFVPNNMDEEHPPERSFPLLSAYICPFCKKILVAYFQGQLSEPEIEYYESDKPRYTFGSVAGGHYIKPENHQGYYGESNRCSWEVFMRRGIVENMRMFAKQHDVPLVLVHPIAEKIDVLSCFCIVKDVCGKDKEMLLFSEDKLLGEIREKEGFEKYWKAKEHLGEYLMGLVQSPVTS